MSSSAVSWVKKKGISLKWKQENGLALTKDIGFTPSDSAKDWD